MGSLTLSLPLTFNRATQGHVILNLRSSILLPISKTEQQKRNMYFLDLNFHYNRNRYLRDLEGRVSLVNSVTFAPSTYFSDQIHPYTHYLDYLLSFHNIGEDLRIILCEKIISLFNALIIDNQIQNHKYEFLNFHVAADVEFVAEELNDMQELVRFLMMMFDDIMEPLELDGLEEVGGGASVSVINKLKNGRVLASEERISDDNCAICLEEFRGGEELIKMTCTHIFHDKCIFRWLETRNSCPLCRREIED